MPEPTRIVEVKQLLVEGADGHRFFAALTSEMALSGIQVQNYGGVTELASFLKALRDTSGFRERVSSVGIVRDAEASASSAFQSVQSAVQNAGWEAPQQPMTPAGDSPKVTVLILPDANRPGMLEDLLLEAVSDDPVIPCVNKYFECVNARLGSVPRPMPKARAHAFLASRERPHLRVGEAADAGYWQLDNAAYNHDREFL
ncbi:MAG: DUF3226 domain-containing protein, partial [Dehalococcoidia bacterium]